MMISTALNQFLDDYVWLRGYSKHTAENYKLAVNSFIKVVGDIPLASLTMEHIKLFKSHLEATHERNGVACYLYRLRLFLRYYKRKNGLDIDLEDLVIPKRVSKLPRYLLPADVTMLIESVPVNRFCWVRMRNQAMISMMYSAGLRLGEIRRMRTKDIRGKEIVVRGKGNKERVVFMDSRTKELVDDYLKARPHGSPILFISIKADSVSKSCIETVVKAAGRKADLNVSPHILRHSFATTLLSGNVNLRHIQDLLGHADISTTQIYTHTIKSNVEADYKRVFK